MNRYHDAMEHCAPPPELEERLREAVLSAEPTPQARPAVFRPKGFVRKAALAAVLAAVLTLSVGAAVLVNWDDIFSDRFGPEGAETPMAEKAFQPVNVSSVCDDVTLTIREALVDEKSIYLILDYQLPDTVDRETVEMADESENWRQDSISLPDISYYLTGDVSWEDLKAADQDKWADIDWTDYTSYCGYMERDGSCLADFRLINYTSGSSGGSEHHGYDPETNTLTYLYYITAKSGDLDFTAQPVTVLLTPPVLRVNGVDTAVTGHPAILTFQPEAISQTLTGSLRQGSLYAQTTVSPFAINVKLGDVSAAVPYESIDDLLRATALVFRVGTTQPVWELATGLTGSTSISLDDSHGSLSFTSHFQELLDVSQVTAVRVGDVEIPLE